jgi:hypothetical protein
MCHVLWKSPGGGGWAPDRWGHLHKFSFRCLSSLASRQLVPARHSSLSQLWVVPGSSASLPMSRSWKVTHSRSRTQQEGSELPSLWAAQAVLRSRVKCWGWAVLHRLQHPCCTGGSPYCTCPSPWLCGTLLLTQALPPHTSLLLGVSQPTRGRFSEQKGQAAVITNRQVSSFIPASSKGL